MQLSAHGWWTRSALAVLLSCAAWGCRPDDGAAPGGDAGLIDGWPVGRDELEDRGREVFLAEGCQVCHDGRPDVPPDSVDLRTLGAPRSAGWHAMHLFEPELARAGSTKAATRAVFEPTTWDAYEGGTEDVPRLTRDGQALVAYLLRLQELPDRRTGWHSGLLPLEGVPTGPDDLYRIFCASCHGSEGNGDGLAAPFLVDESQPRAFRPARYRIRSRPDLPTDDDLLGVITNGLPGTAMPDFSHLPEEARRSLVAFVQGFARTVEDGQAVDPFAEEPREPVAVGDVPPADPGRLARGEELLSSWGCGKCHGDDLSGGWAEDLGLIWLDEVGRPIPWAADLVGGRYKGGETAADIYLRLRVGMGGAPMPSYTEAQPESGDGWAVALALLARREAAAGD